MNGIGIDVSKRRLDVGTSDGQTLQVSNDPSGFAELDLWLRQRPSNQIVLEATGGYEQPVLDFLHKAGHPVVRANALRARKLAQGLGQRAKTDRLDAYALAQMATLVKLPAYQPLEAWQQKLREFVRARRQMIQALAVARQQQEMVGDRELRRLLQANITHLKTLVKRLGKQIAEQLAQQPQLTVLKSMKGVGPVVQAVLASYLPELGHISGKAIASLVGVAPMSHDSGTMRGKRSIHGGRAEIRQVLYMAGMSALQHEPRIRDFYRSLRARGKEAKVAIVAVMRKMLVILNARVRDAQSGPIPA
ncbi:IS110 family transposase [Stenotrophomonas rhizophila]|uniref:IS110 family transposase n=1 Tax=Stenotrophomonas rhizophila TaxID=216778 RepID=UPI000456E0DD|nr:IS110 family transposase [Stenotrophomonas rhizophila]AHY57179.1 transposase [Stenotrophomonas rhizophila]AHY57651.1 transposase [Stenotrophomonas rhizophila]AHY57904.1 transposase [Stenotrophomonas rhizophila]AHY59956.1 transposase [Stenotrophomonas rhizophila]AHY60383.1 transposase [Stenotrophomonas rhizophila]